MRPMAALSFFFLAFTSPIVLLQRGTFTSETMMIIDNLKIIQSTEYMISIRFKFSLLNNTEKCLLATK